MDDSDELKLSRRSERIRVPTAKMLAYQREEQNKKEEGLLHFCEQWKVQIRAAKDSLKTNISENELAVMADNIEKEKDDLMRADTEMRQKATPSSELSCKIDACESVTSDIMRVVFERLSEVDGEFDAAQVKQCLHQLHFCILPKPCKCCNSSPL